MHTLKLWLFQHQCSKHCVNQSFLSYVNWATCAVFRNTNLDKTFHVSFLVQVNALIPEGIDVLIDPFVLWKIYINRSFIHEIETNLLPMNRQGLISDFLMTHGTIFSHKRLKKFLRFLLSPYLERFILYNFISWQNPRVILTYISLPIYRDTWRKYMVM